MRIDFELVFVESLLVFVEGVVGAICLRCIGILPCHHWHLDNISSWTLPQKRKQLDHGGSQERPCPYSYLYSLLINISSHPEIKNKQPRERPRIRSRAICTTLVAHSWPAWFKLEEAWLCPSAISAALVEFSWHRARADLSMPESNPCDPCHTFVAWVTQRQSRVGQVGF